MMIDNQQVREGDRVHHVVHGWATIEEISARAMRVRLANRAQLVAADEQLSEWHLSEPAYLFRPAGMDDATWDRLRDLLRQIIEVAGARR
jgi:hypothetical protein